MILIKQVEQIKQIATELGIIFTYDDAMCQCAIQLPSAYYASENDYTVDPSTVYIFSYTDDRITECLCYDNLIIDEESEKLVWVGREGYDSLVRTFDCKAIKRNLARCLKDLKAKEEELKIKNIEKDFK